VDINTILVIVLVSSMFLSITLYVVMKLLSRKAEKNGTQEIYKSYEELTGTKKFKIKHTINSLLQDSYVAYLKVPLLRKYILKIQKRIQAIHSYDEMTLRRETMKIVFYTLAIMTSFVLLLLLMNNDLTFIFMLFLGALVVNGMLIDTFVHKVEDRLLVQLRDLTKVVRYHFQEHGMVEESLHDASESSSYEASLHAKKIYEVLVSSNPTDSLAAYYEKAPNRFLKAFAGMSFLVKEFGDKIIKDGSLYLNNLNKLASEINLEILKRTRLNYLFKGLTIIAVVPIVFTKPIENWARDHFPSMDEFYTSKFGFFTKIAIFTIILLSYVLLKKMQDHQEGTYVAKVKKWHWEKSVLNWPPVEWLVYRLVPAKRTAEHFKISTLIKDANAGFPLEWHYLHRLVLSVICSVTLLVSFSVTHSIAIKNVLEAPTKNEAMFGKMNEKDLLNAQSITDFDRKIILQLKGVSTNALHDSVVQLIKGDQSIGSNDALLNSTTQRIIHKIQQVDSEYIKWWEVLITLLMGWVGYQAPYWLLQFQKRMRQMDMQNEVDQFHTIIAMLSEIDRVSPEIILEWMERFASIFRAPLHKCVMNYESGAEQALEQLKLDAPFTPLVRIVEKLQRAVERIPVRQAFDDLETDRAFYFEQRKQDYDRSIDTKSGWGRMIGFAPMYAVIFMYTVIPLVYMSIQQMGVYYEQLRKL